MGRDELVILACWMSIDINFMPDFVSHFRPLKEEKGEHGEKLRSTSSKAMQQVISKAFNSKTFVGLLVNFVLIEQKKAEIQSRKVNREL